MGKLQNSLFLYLWLKFYNLIKLIMFWFFWKKDNTGEYWEWVILERQFGIYDEKNRQFTREKTIFKWNLNIDNIKKSLNNINLNLFLEEHEKVIDNVNNIKLKYYSIEWDLEYSDRIYFILNKKDYDNTLLGIQEWFITSFSFKNL